MKLRNKKTGEIREDSDLGKMLIRYAMPSYDSIAELCEEWEDYTPAEPLIKDEKIRKAVRAWAEACGVKQIKYSRALNQYYDADNRGAFAIRFTLIPVEVYLEDGEPYTLAELCGEEDE